MTLIKGLTKEEADTYVAVYRDTLRAGWRRRAVAWCTSTVRLATTT